jgi:hypothetical protein
MSGGIVFVRFFPGYTTSFLFDRFVRLKDDAIGGAVEALCKEWWRKPSNRRRVQTSRTEMELRQREWAQGALARPGKNWCVPGAAASEVANAPAKRIGTPSFEEIAAVAGWVCPTASADFPHGISPRYPVARFNTKEDAEAAVVALQERVAELARAAYAKHHWGDEDDLLATANPRFFVVAEEDLSRPELATARERIKRLNGPAGEHQSPEEGLLRFYLTRIGATLEQVRDAESATNDLGANQPASGTAARESLDPQPVQDDPPPGGGPAVASTPHTEVMRGAASETRPRSDPGDSTQPRGSKLEEFEGHPVGGPLLQRIADGVASIDSKMGAGGAAPSGQSSPRLLFDQETLTITLDGQPYQLDDPRAFSLYRAISEASPDLITRPAIRLAVKGLQGDKTIPNKINSLPEALRDTVESDTRGYWIVLPRCLKKIRN